MKYQELKNYPLGTKIRARRAAKYKTIYPSGKVFQTDDLYGETRLIRAEKWFEGTLIEGPLMKKGNPHPTKKELYILTTQGQKIRLRGLGCFEVVEPTIVA